MKAFLLSRAAVWAGLATLVLGIPTAFAEPLVYVPLGEESRIAIVDVAKNAVVGKIEAVPAVHGLAGTPDGRYLVAGSFDEREMGSGAPAKPSGVSVDDHAAHHGGAPASGKKVSTVVSTVSIVRTSDRSIVRRIDVPGAIHHVAVSPDGRFAVVTHPNEGAISAIDLGSYKVVATIATGPLPNYAAFSPDGIHLYVSNAGNDTVSAVDSKRWIVSWNAVVGSSPEHVVLSADGTTLYVNNVDGGTVSVVAVSDRKVVKTIPVGTTLHGIDLSDDGRTLFVVALGDDKLVRVDLASGDLRSAPLVPAPYHLAVIRGSGKLYVSSADEPKIWVIDQQDLMVLGEIPIGGKGHQVVQGVGE